MVKPVSSVRYIEKCGDYEHIYEAPTVNEVIELYNKLNSKEIVFPLQDTKVSYGTTDTTAVNKQQYACGVDYCEYSTINEFIDLLMCKYQELELREPTVHVLGLPGEQVIEYLKTNHIKIPKGMVII